MSILPWIPGGDEFLEWGGDKLHKWRPDWPTEAPNSSNPPSWFCSPKQTFFELLLWNSFFFGLTAYLILVPGLKPLELPKAGRRKVGLIDHAMGVALCGLIGFTAWYKFATDTVVYLAQPCHVVTLMLIAACWWTERRSGSFIFMLFTHMNLGTFLALMWPDTRDYRRRNIWPQTAILVFFSLHWLLALLPYYYTARRTFHWKRRPLALLWGFAGLGIMHWSILLPASLLAENNVNYMLSPPPGPPRSWGIYYRSLQCILVLPMLALPGMLFPAIADALALALCKLTGWRGAGGEEEGGEPRRSERLRATRSAGGAKKD